MRASSVFLKISVVVCLGLLALPNILPVSPKSPLPILASYNPYPANNFHAPLSSMGLLAASNATLDMHSLAQATATSSKSLGQSIRQNSLRFIIDQSYFPQTETSIAIDPNNQNHVLGGFNDQKFFFCTALPADCAGSVPISTSGFTTSTDGGKSVAKSGNIPDIRVGSTFLVSFGDPSVGTSVDGNFFYSSLALGRFGQNGIMIAKSNSNLFNNTVSCTAPISDPTSNPCWHAVFIFGNLLPFPTSVEDKDLLAVDRAPSSPFFGSVYVSWNHFFVNGVSESFLARCDNDLASCTILSNQDLPVSGDDFFADFTTPVVDKNGNVSVIWCNYGTFATFGPVTCRIRTSSPGGSSFGPANTILSFMGAGTTLPNATVVLGWATEQYRTFSIPSVAADTSQKSNNLYFTIEACTAGFYYAANRINFPFVALDNPGNCGASAILFSTSMDGGVTWSRPLNVAKPAVNDQPYVTVDPFTGRIVIVYYTTQYDQFNHRIDVVASSSNDLGGHFRQIRVTSVSNEPDSDPNMYVYFSPNGAGGAFTVPQYGDYFQAVAMNGNLWVLFTANYSSQMGTFQTDPFLALLGSQASSQN